MAVPYTPPAFATPIINPVIGSGGTPPIPYISNSEFTFAPTALDANHLYPGGTAAKSAQSLADTIRRASRWCDDICFGADAAAKGASLAASLSVQAAMVRVKSGALRLICDYRPIIQVTGLSLGSAPNAVASLTATFAAMTRIGRRTIYVPLFAGISITRSGAQPAISPAVLRGGSLYCVWSYVNGYPHTKLADSVIAGATSCTVSAVDGNGGLWGVYGSSGAFPGSELAIIDGVNTERVFVKSVTTTATNATTTLKTSAFANTHTVPANPDFIPVTAIPEDVHQAVISLVTALIKVRGARALVMAAQPGGRPSQQAMAQAGALEDYSYALKILSDGGYRIRMKSTGAY